MKTLLSLLSIFALITAIASLDSHRLDAGVLFPAFAVATLGRLRAHGRPQARPSVAFRALHRAFTSCRPLRVAAAATPEAGGLTTIASHRPASKPRPQGAVCSFLVPMRPDAGPPLVGGPFSQ